MKKLLIFLVTITSLFLSGNIAFSENQEKIGYIDLSRAFDEYQKTKDLDKELEKKGDRKQTEREKLVQQIRQMREESELMNSAAKEKKELDIESKIKVLQEYDQDAKNELIKDRDNMLRDILKEMNEVIKEYGQTQGYSLILNDKVLLYGDKKLEITDQVIKILNDRYNKSKN